MSIRFGKAFFRWITLKPKEVLFLEKAEDFDVIGEGGAETTQVKDAIHSGNITLNSLGVIEAIANFWRHQQKNPNYLIRFKFLTTSARGMERPAVFSGIKGLDYWDRCKSPNADLRPLRDYLTVNTALPEDLRQFILNSSDEELRSKLISRIEWASGLGGREYVKELITKWVIAYGTANAVQPSESEKVVSHLFTHVLEVIRKGQERQLNLADFATLFEEKTTRRFTAQQIQSIRLRERANVLGLDNLQTASSPAFTPIFESNETSYDLPSLDQMAERADIVSNLQGKLNTKGLLILRGSSGMGKSVLAVLASNKDGGQWKRLDFRDLAPEQIKEHLIYATILEAEEKGCLDYIVDDLNFDSHPSKYERALAGFLQR